MHSNTSALLNTHVQFASELSGHMLRSNAGALRERALLPEHPYRVFWEKMTLTFSLLYPLNYKRGSGIAFNRMYARSRSMHVVPMKRV